MNHLPSPDRTAPRSAQLTPPSRDESMGDRSNTIEPDESETRQIPRGGPPRPADDDSLAVGVLNKKPPGEAQDEQPPFAPGINPFMWRRRVRSYLDDSANWVIERRNAAIEEYLPSTKRGPVIEAIGNAIRSLLPGLLNFTTASVFLNALVSISSTLLLLATPVVAFLLAQPNVGGWVRVGTAGLALAIYLGLLWLAVSSVYLWIRLRSPQRAVKPRRGQLTANPGSALSFPLIVFLLLLAILPAVVAGLPPRVRGALPLRVQDALPLHLQGAQFWLSDRWFHAALSTATWAFGVWIMIFIGSNLFIRIYWSLAWRRMSSRLPEQQFIDRVTSLITSTSTKKNSSDEGADAPLTPLQYVHVMEDIANNFEQYWPRQLRTGYAHVDHAARIWARRVAAAIRAQELPLLIGQHRPVDMSPPLADVVVKVILKSAFEEDLQDDKSYRRAVWWRRLGRPALAGILLLATAALVFLAAWQPGLPHLLKTWGQTGLANTISLPNDLRPGMLAGAFAVFGLFVKVVAPNRDRAGGNEPRI